MSFSVSYPKSIAQKEKIFSQDKSLQFMDYRDRSRLTFPPFQMSSLKAQKGDTVTQLRSFTVLSRPFIQGLQGNELTRSAYSQPAMISHGRRTSTTSLTRVSRPSSPPLFLSIHQSLSLPEGTILADRGYESSSPPPSSLRDFAGLLVELIGNRRKRYPEI